MLTRILRQGRNQKGFTLIELLVVVAIIALLTAFAVPKIFDAISNARGARGQSDMDTITAAMDRYYFDQSKFPVGANALDTKKLLWNGYLKQTTTFTNGHKKGYIYLTDANGNFYVLIDPANTAAATDIDVTCNSKVETATINASADFQIITAAVITKDDVAKGCTISPTLSFTTN